MQQGSAISFDLNICSRISRDNQTDYFDRIKQQIKLLQLEHEQLQAQLKYIQQNPYQLIQSFQSKLLRRIGQLREENQGIEQLIEKSKIPGYAQMTKKKVSYLSQTPGNSKGQEDQWSDFERRNPFDSVQMSQKMQASTCQNFPIQSNSDNPLRTLQPLQDHQLRSRAQLTAELLQVINRTSEISTQTQKIESSNEPLSSLHQIALKSRNIEQISKYKQRLIQLLKKLKAREASQEQIVREYQRMYEMTLKQLKQATQLLNQLTSVNTTDSLDDLFAEVLQLEERLAYINQQLERVDESQWLKDIYNELVQALRRIGLCPPQLKSCPTNTSLQQLREQIDILAQMLIECAVGQRCDEKQKLSLLKMYYQEQKETNKKILKNLQNKEQGLSKKLIDMQMNN